MKHLGSYPEVEKEGKLPPKPIVASCGEVVVAREMGMFPIAGEQSSRGEMEAFTTLVGVAGDIDITHYGFCFYLRKEGWATVAIDCRPILEAIIASLELQWDAGDASDA